ncbi:MAG: hypothetical protein LBG84_06425 [Treponema sp.]|jgi:hypothetical protein|nr:hypothetical protein [Treponema sp.]
MKRTIAFVVFGLFMVSMQVVAQSKPIMGYDKVPWGASVADVRRAYSISDDVVLKTNDEDANLKQLFQDNVTDSIKQRIFNFIDGKLYRVSVLYKDPSDSNEKNLESILVNRFGRQTNYDIQTGTEYLMFQPINYTATTKEFGQYSPELVVDLIHLVYSAGFERDTNNLLGQNQLLVRYTWKKFRDEYQASKLGL